LRERSITTAASALDRSSVGAIFYLLGRQVLKTKNENEGVMAAFIAGFVLGGLMGFIMCGIMRVSHIEKAP